MEANDNLQVVADLAQTMEKLDPTSKNVINRLLNKLVLSEGSTETSKPVAKIKNKPKINDNEMNQYVEQIRLLVKEVIDKHHKFTCVFDVIKYVKARLTNDYGIVFTEIINDYKKTFERYPNNEYVILFWAEECYPTIKGLVRSILEDLLDETQKDLKDNTSSDEDLYNIPCKSIDDVEKSLEFIMQTKYPDYSTRSIILQPFYKSKLSSMDIDAIFKRRQSQGAKSNIATMDLIKRYGTEEEQKLYVQKFNEFVNEKYKDIIKNR